MTEALRPSRLLALPLDTLGAVFDFFTPVEIVKLAQVDRLFYFLTKLYWLRLERNIEERFKQELLPIYRVTRDDITVGEFNAAITRAIAAHRPYRDVWSDKMITNSDFSYSEYMSFDTTIIKPVAAARAIQEHNEQNALTILRRDHATTPTPHGYVLAHGQSTIASIFARAPPPQGRTIYHTYTPTTSVATLGESLVYTSIDGMALGMPLDSEALYYRGEVPRMFAEEGVEESIKLLQAFYRLPLPLAKRLVAEMRVYQPDGARLQAVMGGGPLVGCAPTRLAVFDNLVLVGGRTRSVEMGGYAHPNPLAQPQGQLIMFDAGALPAFPFVLPREVRALIFHQLRHAEQALRVRFESFTQRAAQHRRRAVHVEVSLAVDACGQVRVGIAISAPDALESTVGVDVYAQQRQDAEAAHPTLRPVERVPGAPATLHADSDFSRVPVPEDFTHGLSLSQLGALVKWLRKQNADKYDSRSEFQHSVYAFYIANAHEHQVTAIAGWRDSFGSNCRDPVLLYEVENKKAAVPYASLLSGSEGGVVSVWSQCCGDRLACWRAHEGAVTAIETVPNSDIITASTDGTIRTWALLTTKETKQMNMDIYDEKKKANEERERKHRAKVKRRKLRKRRRLARSQRMRARGTAIMAAEAALGKDRAAAASARTELLSLLGASSIEASAEDADALALSIEEMCVGNSPATTTSTVTLEIAGLVAGACGGGEESEDAEPGTVVEMDRFFSVHDMHDEDAAGDKQEDGLRTPTLALAHTPTPSTLAVPTALLARVAALAPAVRVEVEVVRRTLREALTSVRAGEASVAALRREGEEDGEVSADSGSEHEYDPEDPPKVSQSAEDQVYKGARTRQEAAREGAAQLLPIAMHQRNSATEFVQSLMPRYLMDYTPYTDKYDPAGEAAQRIQDRRRARKLREQLGAEAAFADAAVTRSIVDASPTVSDVAPAARSTQVAGPASTTPSAGAENHAEAATHGVECASCPHPASPVSSSPAVVPVVAPTPGSEPAVDTPRYCYNSLPKNIRSLPLSEAIEILLRVASLHLVTQQRVCCVAHLNTQLAAMTAALIDDKAPQPLSTQLCAHCAAGNDTAAQTSVNNTAVIVDFDRYARLQLLAAVPVYSPQPNVWSMDERGKAVLPQPRGRSRKTASATTAASTGAAAPASAALSSVSTAQAFSAAVVLGNGEEDAERRRAVIASLAEQDEAVLERKARQIAEEDGRDAPDDSDYNQTHWRLLEKEWSGLLKVFGQSPEGKKEEGKKEEGKGDATAAVDDTAIDKDAVSTTNTSKSPSVSISTTSPLPSPSSLSSSSSSSSSASPSTSSSSLSPSTSSFSSSAAADVAPATALSYDVTAEASDDDETEAIIEKLRPEGHHFIYPVVHLTNSLPMPPGFGAVLCLKRVGNTLFAGGAGGLCVFDLTSGRLRSHVLSVSQLQHDPAAMQVVSKVPAGERARVGSCSVAGYSWGWGAVTCMEVVGSIVFVGLRPRVQAVLEEDPVPAEPVVGEEAHLVREAYGRLLSNVADVDAVGSGFALAEALAALEDSALAQTNFLPSAPHNPAAGTVSASLGAVTRGDKTAIPLEMDPRRSITAHPPHSRALPLSLGLSPAVDMATMNDCTNFHRKQRLTRKARGCLLPADEDEEWPYLPCKRHNSANTPTSAIGARAAGEARGDNEATAAAADTYVSVDDASAVDVVEEEDESAEGYCPCPTCSQGLPTGPSYVSPELTDDPAYTSHSSADRVARQRPEAINDVIAEAHGHPVLAYTHNTAGLNVGDRYPYLPATAFVKPTRTSKPSDAVIVHASRGAVRLPRQGRIEAFDWTTGKRLYTLYAGSHIPVELSMRLPTFFAPKCPPEDSVIKSTLFTHVTPVDMLRHLSSVWENYKHTALLAAAMEDEMEQGRVFAWRWDLLGRPLSKEVVVDNAAALNAALGITPAMMSALDPMLRSAILPAASPSGTYGSVRMQNVNGAKLLKTWNNQEHCRVKPAEPSQLAKRLLGQQGMF